MAAEVVDGGAADVAPARRRLRPFVVSALAAPTGPGLLAGLLSLSGRADLSAREAVEVTAAWTRMISFCTAGQLNGVRDVDRAFAPDPGVAGSVRPGRTDPVRPAADELAPVLGIAPQTASRLVSLARRVEAMPAAADALAEGRMSYAQLKVTEQVTRDLPGPTAATVEATAVRWAPRKTTAQLRTDLASEAVRLDPEHASTAAARGVAERDVSWRPSPLPGCRRLVADLPLLDGAAAWHALNGAAKNTKKVVSAPTAHPRTAPWPSCAPTCSPRS